MIIKKITFIHRVINTQWHAKFGLPFFTRKTGLRERLDRVGSGETIARQE